MDEILEREVRKKKDKNWDEIAKNVGMDTEECKVRWKEGIEGGKFESVKVGPWTEEEDRVLASAVKEWKGRNWKEIWKYVKGRNDNAWYQRWARLEEKGYELKENLYGIQELQKMVKIEVNGDNVFFNPKLMKDPCKDDILLLQLYQKYGAKWVDFWKVFENGTPSSIKERFYSILEWVANTHSKDDISLQYSSGSNILSELQEIKTKNKKLLSFIPLAVKHLNADPSKISQKVLSKLGFSTSKPLKPSSHSKPIPWSQPTTSPIPFPISQNPSPSPPPSPTSLINSEVTKVLCGHYNFTFSK